LHHYNDDIDDFDHLAATIIDDDVIKNLLLAPDGIVTQVYPRQGNESVLGLNFFTQGAGNKEAILARKMGALVLGGPFISVQGEQIIVGRLPVYQQRDSKENTFWGLVSITLKFPQVLDGVGLNTLKSHGLTFELWRINPDNGEKQIIANDNGSGSNQGYFIEERIDIFNAVWYLRISTTRTWYEYPENWVMVTATFFISLLIIVIIQKNFQLKKASDKLQYIANTDALTGIFNRHYFMDFTSIYCTKMIRTKENCYIVIFDLDYFKKINDSYGHVAGDMVLRDVTDRIKTCIRAYDVFARYGGEEFIIFFSGIEEEDLLNLVERCRQILEARPVAYECYTIPVTASFGIAAVNAEEDLKSAIISADSALYQAKKEGRNKFVLYKSEAHSASHNECAMVD
jgi:diguanylate cyclase (GGDEF)-like protein